MIINQPIAFFDVESTGKDVSKDRIVQLAIMVSDIDGGTTQHEYLINPSYPISQEAIDVHGITAEAVKDAPTFAEVAVEIYEILKGCAIAGFNSDNFDIPMLHKEFERVGVMWDLEGVNIFDIKKMYSRLFPRTLKAVHQYYFGVDFDNAHDAMADTDATRRVFFKMLGMGIKGETPINTMEDLSLYSNYDRRRADIAGKFYYNEDDKLCFAFGKHKDEVVSKQAHFGFLSWMVRNDFQSDAKAIAKSFL